MTTNRNIAQYPLLANIGQYPNISIVLTLPVVPYCAI